MRVRVRSSHGVLRVWFTTLTERFLQRFQAILLPTGLASSFDDREPHPHPVFLGILALSSTRGQPRAANPLTKKGHNSPSTRGKRRGSDWAASRRENGQKP